MRAWSAAGALLLALAAPAALAQAYVFPAWRHAAQVKADCARMLADLHRQARAIEQGPDDGAATLRALDALWRRGEDTTGPLDLLAAVHPAKPIRDAADACGVAYQAFVAGFHQNARVYRRLKAVQPADAIDARLQRDQLDAFEDAGVALAPAPQRRARAINRTLTRLAQDYDRQVREERRRVPFTAAELQGVPESVWRGAPRDAQGRYLLGLESPTADPVREHAHDAAARERLWRAEMARGGRANLALLGQLAELRREYARLFGFPSYADFALRRQMAGSEAAARSFLAEVQQAVAQRERSDIELLREAKARQLGTPLAATTLQRWDVDYQLERVRAATYAIDQEAMRVHFPPEPSLRFVFGLAEQLFGVRFAPVPQALWHADVRAFLVSDAADGRALGTLFVDLYPRADKYGHAAVWPLLNASAEAGRRPVAALVVNFNRQGLTLDELETLLHEFGHALHVLLSTTRHALQGGTNVPVDFVEAPSQMLEDWVYDPAVLQRFQQVCAECPPVPAVLVERAARARHFAKGLRTARQLLYAGYDLTLYGRTREAPLPLWARMEGATPLGHVPGTMFPANFSHIASGYSAGYYGYLWSLALAEDLRTPFAADKLDAAVGRRYRETVLAQGAQVAPEEQLRRFLGRPANRDAFFRWLAQQ